MGGTPTYEYRDGQRLAPAVASDFDRMAADYFRDIGYTLHIAPDGGLRTRARQQYFYDGWNRRLPGFNKAAHPDDPKAYHVESNPNGARAVDIYDSGPAGVGPSSGTGAGHQWMLDHAHEYGFANEGMTFHPREPWHKLWTGPDPWSRSATASLSEEDDMFTDEDRALLRDAKEALDRLTKVLGGSVREDGTVTGGNVIDRLRTIDARAKDAVNQNKRLATVVGGSVDKDTGKVVGGNVVDRLRRIEDKTSD